MTQSLYRLRNAIFKPSIFLDEKTPVAVSPTPFVLTESVYQDLIEHAANVYTALEKITRSYVDIPATRDLFPEYAGIRDLSILQPAKGPLLHLARFDLAVLASGGFRIMETNAGCPGGIANVGFINNSFFLSEDTADVTRSSRLQLDIDREDYFVSYLAGQCAEAESIARAPTLAFISSRHRRIVTDLDRLTEIAAKNGYNAIRCDVQDLSYDGKYLRYNDQRIDCAFLKFDTVIDDDGDCDLGIYGKKIDGPDMPLMQALANGALFYVNTLPSILVAESKRSLALLHDPEFRKDFTNSERTSIDMLVARTSYLGLDREGFWPLDEIIQNKDAFVVKSVIDTRGRGVYLGRHHSQSEWESLLSCSCDGKHIVQEFLALDRQPVANPMGPDGTVDAYTDIGLFMLGGKAGGFLCRASSKPIVNVGNGGAMRPTAVTRDSFSIRSEPVRRVGKTASQASTMQPPHQSDREQMKCSLVNFDQHFRTLLEGNAASVTTIKNDYVLRGALADAAHDITRRVKEGDEAAEALMHGLLFDYYRSTFSTVPAGRAHVDVGGAILDLVTIFEEAMIAREEAAVDWEAHADMPMTGAAFVEWFQKTARAHKAWDHPFYIDFLAKRAEIEDMKYYLAQETTLDPQFDDCLALIQIGTSGGVKLEIASNYWDEMGGGKPEEVHTTLFAHALSDIGVDDDYLTANISLASKISGNLSSAFCLKRRQFHKAIGYFGVTEYMAPHRFKCVVEGWRRNRLPLAGIIYHDLHIGVDAGHALGWLHNVIAPLVDADPAAAQELARGALYRLNSSNRYLDAAYTVRLAQGT